MVRAIDLFDTIEYRGRHPNDFQFIDRDVEDKE